MAKTDPTKGHSQKTGVVALVEPKTGKVRARAMKANVETVPMFTIIAFVALGVIVWFSERRESEERSIKNIPSDDDFLRARILFIRQDVRLVAYTLAGILIMLGVIADRIR